MYRVYMPICRKIPWEPLFSKHQMALSINIYFTFEAAFDSVWEYENTFTIPFSYFQFHNLAKYLQGIFFSCSLAT